MFFGTEELGSGSTGTGVEAHTGRALQDDAAVPHSNVNPFDAMKAATVNGCRAIACAGSEYQSIDSALNVESLAGRKRHGMKTKSYPAHEVCMRGRETVSHTPRLIHAAEKAETAKSVQPSSCSAFIKIQRFGNLPGGREAANATRIQQKATRYELFIVSQDECCRTRFRSLRLNEGCSRTVRCRCAPILSCACEVKTSPRAPKDCSMLVARYFFAQSFFR